MPQRFIAVDFETANADLSSICQIGAVTFEDEKVVEAWGSLVNPEDYFDGINVSIHGIEEGMVEHAPKFRDLFGPLATRLRGQIVVSHTSFDRTALAQALKKYKLAEVDCIWLDSARVVRRTWSEFSRKGYGLGNVCEMLGIQFKHHDASEDARAAGEVLLRAMKITGLDIEGWLKRVKQPIDLLAGRTNGSVAVRGNPDGPLAGEEVVFTGTLSMTRREAAALAATLGCDVAPSVNKNTTLLVVGDQDICKLAGKQKSAKHRKAEELVGRGQSIRFLKESDFLRLVTFVH